MIKVRYNKRELMFQLPLHIMLSETNKITRELIEREREREKVRERERERERKREKSLFLFRALGGNERALQTADTCLLFCTKNLFFPFFFPNESNSPLYPSQICAFKLKRRKRERERKRDDRRSSYYVLNNAPHDLLFALYTIYIIHEGFLKTCLQVKMPSSIGASSWRQKHHLHRDERTR